jgi:acyl dehydratase
MTMALPQPEYCMATAPQFVGREFGASDWVAVDQHCIDAFAACTGDRQWIHVDVERAGRESQYGGTIAHGYLTLSLAPAVISQVLEIREVTAALNYGLNKVRFPSPVRVGAQIRAAVTVMSAQQKTSGVESVFTVTYEIDGEDRPACVADVIVLYP